jgi:hypothetical protein
VKLATCQIVSLPLQSTSPATAVVSCIASTYVYAMCLAVRMSTPVAPALLAFPQLLVEDSDAVSHVSEAMRAEGSQRRATSRQGMRSDVEGARHDAFVSKTNRDLDVTGAVGKRDDTGSKGRKKKPAAVADRFSASERFGFSSRYGIDPTQYKQHHVGELGNVGTRERGERDDLGMGSWSGHTLRDVPRSKPAVAVAKCAYLVE